MEVIVQLAFQMVSFVFDMLFYLAKALHFIWLYIVLCFSEGFSRQTSGTVSKTGPHQTVLLFQKPLRITAAEQNSGYHVKWSVHYRGQLTFQQFTQVHIQFHIQSCINKTSALDSAFLLSMMARVCPVYHCCKSQTPRNSHSKAGERRACLKLA